MTGVVPIRRTARGWGATIVLCVGMFPIQAGMAKDLLIPKAQENTEIGPTQSPSFDHQEKDIPQSLFTWITIAKGFEVEWDTFGRKGWYSQDPRLKPIESGTVFMPEIPALYVVFEVAPLEDPAQFAVLWYLQQSDGKLKEIGKDALEVPGHERYGYLELKRPGERWATGKYLVKIYITSLGQQPFHAVNQVGTMHFTVTDTASPVHPEQKSSTIHGN